MNLWPSDCPCLVQPLCIVWWKPGCHCLSLCMCPSHPTCGPTPFLECVHASIQEFMSTWLLSSGPALCILWCQVGCPCIGVCLCPSHLISDPSPCLECVHVSVHKFRCGNKWDNWDTKTLPFRGTQVSIKLHRIWTRPGQSGTHNYMYWCMYTL